MTRVVALLRAVNVGGTGKVVMSELCAGLEAKLEAAVASALGVKTEFFVRSAREWDAIVAGNPYARAAQDDPSRLVVLTFKSVPAAKAVAALQAAIVGRETVSVAGKHAYAVYPDGQGTSKLTNAIFERKLGTSCTARNWNTVLKLAAAAAAPS